MIGGHDAAKKATRMRKRLFPESELYPGYYRLFRCKNIVLVVRRPDIVSTVLSVVIAALLIRCALTLFAN